MRDMEDGEFERSLRLGLGRAVLFLQTHASAPYRATILQGVLHNQAYQPQFEGDRAAYMLDIIAATEEATFYHAQILEAVPSTTEDWDLDHLLGMVRRLAQQGHQLARDLLYAYVVTHFTDGINGADQIVVLDGLSAFRLVAELWAKLDPDDAIDCLDDSLLVLLEERYGVETTHQQLAILAQDDHSVATYVEAIARDRLDRNANKEARMQREDRTLAEVQDLIRARGARAPRGQLGRWGQNASDMDLSRAATGLLTETDPSRQRGYLYLFWSRPFPFEPAPLLYLAESVEVELAFAATKALVPLAHPAVRTWACA